MTESQESKINAYLPLIAPGLLLFFLLSTSIRPISLGYDLYNNKRILEIIILFFVNLSGVMAPVVRDQVFKLWRKLPQLSQGLIIIFFGLGVTSALLSPHPFFSLTDVALHLSLLTGSFILAASYLLQPQKILKLCASGIAILIILSSFNEAIGIYVYLSQGRQPGSAELFAYFTHPRFFNQIQSWLLPAVFLLPLTWPEKRSFWFLSILATSCWWALMIISGGRGSMLGLLIAIFFSSVLYSFTSSRLPESNSISLKYLKHLLISLALGVILFLIFISIPNWIETKPGTLIEDSVGRGLNHTSGRITIWKMALTGVFEYPYLGIGPGLYSCLTPTTWYPAHPHSGYIQILSEWGPVASLVFLVLAFNGLKGIVIAIRQTGSPIGLVLFTAFIAATIHMAVSGLWVMPAAQISGVLICGLLLGWVFQQKTRLIELKIHQSATVVFLAGTILLTQFIIGVFLYTQLPELRRIDKQPTEIHKQIPAPGFWQEGLMCQEGKKVTYTP